MTRKDIRDALSKINDAEAEYRAQQRRETVADIIAGGIILVAIACVVFAAWLALW